MVDSDTEYLVCSFVALFAIAFFGSALRRPRLDALLCTISDEQMFLAKGVGRRMVWIGRAAISVKEA